METNQIKLLMKLAKELKAKSKTNTKEEALKSLQDAGILDKSGRYSKHYPELRKLSSR